MHRLAWACFLYAKIMYNLPKFDHSSIMDRTAAYCRKRGIDLTLSYALYLTGMEDAEEIYLNSVKYYSYFSDTYWSYSQFSHNYYYAVRHYQEFRHTAASIGYCEQVQNISDYFCGLFERLTSLKRKGFVMQQEEAIGTGFHLRRWVYEQR